MPSDLAQRLAQVASLDRNEDAPTVVPFGDWQPDLPALANSGALVTQNVIPYEMSYGPQRAPTPQAPAVNSRVRGAIAADDTNNNSYVYAGTQDKLYEVRPEAVADKSSIAYTTGDNERWDATIFNERVIFTNYANPVQAIVAGAAGNFADLFTSTNKPNARYCDTVRQFLVLGNTNDATSGVRPNRIWWSAFGNPLSMDPDATTQSDYEDLSHGGAVQRIVGGGDYGVIFQENQIRRMSYTGDARVFDLTPIDRQRGTPVPFSVVGHGRNVYYIAESGFYRFTGTESVPIGDGKVDRTFWAQFDPNNAHLVSASIDYTNKLVSWLFPGSGSGGLPNTIYHYNWARDRWSQAAVDGELLFASRTQGYTLEQLDTVSPSIETIPYSLDDPIWQGGAFKASIFTPAHRLAYFSGATLGAVVSTGEVQLHRGRRSLVDFARPLVDGADARVYMVTRNRTSDEPTAHPEALQNDSGECPVDAEARYHRAAIRIPQGEDWTHAQGVELMARISGED